MTEQPFGFAGRFGVHRSMAYGTSKVEAEKCGELRVADGAIRPVGDAPGRIEIFREHGLAPAELPGDPCLELFVDRRRAQRAVALDLDEAAGDRTAPGVQAPESQVGPLQAHGIADFASEPAYVSVKLQVVIQG